MLTTLPLINKKNSRRQAARPELFPVNALRNLAISSVKTSHFMYLDVDFWPSSNLYDQLHSKDTLLALSSDPKLAVVVPAFQRLDFDCDIYPPNKDGGGKAKPLHLSSPGIVSGPEMQGDIDKCVEHFKASMPTGQGEGN